MKEYSYENINICSKQMKNQSYELNFIIHL